MHPLWRGTWETKARIVSGLILFLYALFHFLNIALGLVSPAAMEAFQSARQVLSRSLAGTLVLYGAFLTHAALAFWRVGRRGTLRMPAREAMQLTFGLAIPAFLATHIIFTRGAHEIFGVNDDYTYLIGLIWNSPSAWTQAALLLIVWTHGAIGLHVWLRALPWWRRAQPVLIALAVLVPTLALTGFVTEGRRVAAEFADPDRAARLYALSNWPEAPAFATMTEWKATGIAIFWGLMALSLSAYVARRLRLRRQSVTISYVDGPRVTAPKGLTLLEMSRLNGVPHTSLCGGKGRCTTCRVVFEAGGDTLPPPAPHEAQALEAVGAPAGTRLACQVRPDSDATVFRVFQPDGRTRRAHASSGEERRMSLLFLDMRGFTARTTGQLPYDVVFLLNRFFDAIVPAIVQAGGKVDKYLGDGLLAVFDRGDARQSAEAALLAAEGVGAALEAFNDRLAAEGAAPVRIGMGLHAGDIVLGDIGAAQSAARTIIGEAVNAASRLEAETKALGVEVLVSAAVLHDARIDTQDLSLIRLDLRGVQETVEALPLVRAVALGDPVLRGADPR